MKWLIPLVGLLAFGVLSCTEKEPGYHVEEYQGFKVEDLSSEIKIPATAWDLLEGKAAEAEHREAESGGHGGGAPAAATSLAKDFVFSEVTVYLVEKNDNVLKKPAFKISFPRGGGEVDLSQFTGISNGTFYVGFDFPEFTEAQDKKVIFVSQSKKRKIDDEVYGLGCNQFADITNKYFEMMPKMGLKVNTTRDRHLSVLGGHFLFSAHKGNTIYVSQVTFKDSTKNFLFCEAP